MKLTPDEFRRAVFDAIQSIPREFRDFLEDVSIEVAAEPTVAEAERAGVPPDELLGLYDGVPLTERSMEDGPHPGDRITIYQRNLERMCRTRAELVEEIAITVRHEIGHFFGLDEDELDDLGHG